MHNLIVCFLSFQLFFVFVSEGTSGTDNKHNDTIIILYLFFTKACIVVIQQICHLFRTKTCIIVSQCGLILQSLCNNKLRKNESVSDRCGPLLAVGSCRELSEAQKDCKSLRVCKATTLWQHILGSTLPKKLTESGFALNSFPVLSDGWHTVSIKTFGSCDFL